MKFPDPSSAESFSNIQDHRISGTTNLILQNKVLGKSSDRSYIVNISTKLTSLSPGQDIFKPGEGRHGNVKERVSEIEYPVCRPDF